MPHRQFAVIDFNSNSPNRGYNNMTMHFKLSSGKLERDPRNDSTYKLTTWPQKMAEFSTRDSHHLRGNPSEVPQNELNNVALSAPSDSRSANGMSNQMMLSNNNMMQPLNMPLNAPLSSVDLHPMTANQINYSAPHLPSNNFNQMPNNNPINTTFNNPHNNNMMMANNNNNNNMYNNNTTSNNGNNNMYYHPSAPLLLPNQQFNSPQSNHPANRANPSSSSSSSSSFAPSPYPSPSPSFSLPPIAPAPSAPQSFAPSPNSSNFFNANPSNANPSNANPSNSNFSNANLSNPNLSNANLSNPNLNKMKISFLLN